jgi:hypothetical protein
MMKHAINPKHNGFALLVVLVYIFATAVIVTGVSSTVISAMRVSSTFDASRQAMEAAEYGEVQALMRYCESGEVSLGLSAWMQQNAAPDTTATKMRLLPPFNDPGVQPQSMPVVPGSEYITRVRVLDEKTERKPAGLIDKMLAALGAAPLKTDSEQHRTVVVYAAGRCKNITRCIEAIYHIIGAENAEQQRQFTRIAWREIHPAVRAAIQ